MTNDMTKLNNYCKEAISAGAAHALITNPGLVVTAPWVQWKCRFGCEDYGKWYCCSPNAPTWEQTRQVLDSYNRLILLHFQYRFQSHTWPPEGEDFQKLKKHADYIISLERELFLDGFYRAFTLSHDPCQRCKKCAPMEGQPCTFPEKIRPSAEGVGIDVYQTARNHNLPIHVIKNEAEVCNFYALVLVD